MDDPKLVEESLHLPGGEHLGPVTGQHHRDAEDRQVGSENVDDLQWLLDSQRGGGP